MRRSIVSTNKLGYGILIKDQHKITQTLGWYDYYAIYQTRLLSKVCIMKKSVFAILCTLLILVLVQKKYF